MSSLAIKFDGHAVDVRFTKTALLLVLADGREISAPLAWFPKLSAATEKDRNHWRLIANGLGVHWPSLDEDIAVKTLMQQD